MPTEARTFGALLLDDVARFVRRFVVVRDVQADTAALWAAHTHAFDAADTTPYLALTSATMRSGKSKLLEVLELVVASPLPAANMSDAALFRAIDDEAPTLLLDEADAIFGKRAREREDLRGMLNAGWRRGAVALRMGGARMTKLERFAVFCPKAFAGIGDYLPDTLADRAIVMRLERRTRDEPLERFRRRDVVPEGEVLRDRLADWLEPQVDELRAARPPLPEVLDDRAQDFWEPLLALGDLAGGDWPERSRLAAVELSTGEAREDDSLSARLLGDLHTVFSANGAERLRTADLLDELYKIEESPWGDWHGKPLTAHALSRLLRPYRIKTLPVWVDGKTGRGYKLEQFADAFHRVLSVRSVRTVRSGTATDAGPNGPNAPNASGTWGGQDATSPDEHEHDPSGDPFEQVDDDELEAELERLRAKVGNANERRRGDGTDPGGRAGMEGGP
jgi:hypothetical protein